MKIYKDIQIPAQITKRAVGKVCDWCKKEYDIDWDAKAFEREETEISYESGNVYPEGAFTTTIKCDICPKCFQEKLVPLLEEQGINFYEEEMDW